jgi:2-keto-myo-inositol isomerase
MIKCGMVSLRCLALNRIASPRLGLEAFYRLCRLAGIGKAELRNDLPGKGIIDGLPPREAARAAKNAEIEVISINALQKFNLKSARTPVLKDLKRLLELCRDISCPALVLCPNNDPADRRSPAERRAETADSLAAFAPLFRDANVTGLVEPLGFGISSLPSAALASDIIRESGADCYKILLDTFHHYIGPETQNILGARLEASRIGLVHISGVEEDLPRESLRDEHRVLPSDRDRMNSREQVRTLLEAGYGGNISFEPFSPRIGDLSPEDLITALGKSIAYLNCR